MEHNPLQQVIDSLIKDLTTILQQIQAEASRPVPDPRVLWLCRDNLTNLASRCNQLGNAWHDQILNCVLLQSRSLQGLNVDSLLDNINGKITCCGGCGKQTSLTPGDLIRADWKPLEGGNWICPDCREGIEN